VSCNISFPHEFIEFTEFGEVFTFNGSQKGTK
jgi:hypothetical protein